MNLVKEMHSWFRQLWEARQFADNTVDCFECGKTMRSGTYKDNSCCYSHILGKKKYPALALKEDNVVIVCPDCHNLYELRPSKAIKQYNLKQQLIGLYNI